MNCSKCGKQLLPNEMICSSCGHNNNMSYVNNVNNGIVVNNNTSSVGSVSNETVVQNTDLSYSNNQNINNVVPFNEDNSINLNANQASYSNDVVNEQGTNNDNTGVNQSNSESNDKRENKKLLFLVLTLVGILLIIGVVFLIVKPFEKNENEKRLIEKSYTMYVKINPLVKLNVKEKYYECTDSDTGDVEICSEIGSEVVAYSLINNDAKEIYDGLDLKTKTLVDALVTLYDTARENDLDFTNIEITTNWDNRYTNSELMNEIKEKSKYSEQFSITIDVKSGEITTTQILKKYDINEDVEITYTVVFNSEGGSTIEEQIIEEKGKVVKPEDPTRNGFKFVEWQLNGETYDFDSEVLSDIELKAKWEKEQIVVENNNNIVPEEDTKPDKDNTPDDNNQPEGDNAGSEDDEDNWEIGAPISSLSNINLNDNIMVEIHEGIDPEGMVMGYIITTNVEEIFGNDIFVADNGQKMINNYVEGFDEKYNQLVFNDMLELSTLALTERMGSNLPAGVSSFTCSKNDRRMINCQTKYLSISYDMQEQFADLTEQLYNSVNIALSYPNQAFSDAVYISPGGMGVGPGEPVLLTEEICTEYNLTCSRW